MTYLLLNLAFLVPLILLAIILKKRPNRTWWIALAIVLALTAIFDPIIIALGIVAYDPTLILGIRWFGAPVEDFFYALLAAGLVPLLWHILGKKYEKHSR